MARPKARAGEVLLRNLFVSLDPYQRSMMGNSQSDGAPLAIGQTIAGATVAVVEHSNHPGFAAGDHVVSFSGWQEYGVSDGGDLRKIDASAAPPSASLSVLGLTGLTAWIGLTKILGTPSGPTLLVTAAAGAVGSIACQIAKLRGYRVVGIAGGDAKRRYLLDELHVDAAVDYKSANFPDVLAKVVPDGIDAVFESVGATMVGALLPHLNEFASVAICGTLSQYNSMDSQSGPDQLPALLSAMLWKRLTFRGFSVSHYFDCYPEFLAEMNPWVRDGQIMYAEDVVHGLEQVPAAFPRLFEGRTLGKLIASV